MVASESSTARECMRMNDDFYLMLTVAIAVVTLGCAIPMFVRAMMRWSRSLKNTGERLNRTLENLDTMVEEIKRARD